MLVDYVLESQNAGLFESVLFPLDIYNDSAQHALVTLKQRFLYDEIEAEVFSLIIQYLSLDSSDLPQGILFHISWPFLCYRPVF